MNKALCFINLCCVFSASVQLPSEVATTGLAEHKSNDGGAAPPVLQYLFELWMAVVAPVRPLLRGAGALSDEESKDDAASHWEEMEVCRHRIQAGWFCCTFDPLPYWASSYLRCSVFPILIFKCVLSQR